MGFLDKLKGTGVLTAAEPEDGVEPQPADEVKRRLLAITGKGIETGMDEDDVVVAWSAQVDSVGPGGAGHSYLYRALRIELDEPDHEAKGIGLKTETDAEIGLGGNFSGGAKWERGQHMGSETMHVIAWLGLNRYTPKSRSPGSARTGPRAAPTRRATSSPGATCATR